MLLLSESSASLIGKVSQLESMVKLLQEDLKKVSEREVNWIIACKAADGLVCGCFIYLFSPSQQ